MRSQHVLYYEGRIVKGFFTLRFRRRICLVHGCEFCRKGNKFNVFGQTSFVDYNTSRRHLIRKSEVCHKCHGFWRTCRSNFIESNNDFNWPSVQCVSSCHTYTNGRQSEHFVLSCDNGEDTPRYSRGCTQSRMHAYSHVTGGFVSHKRCNHCLAKNDSYADFVVWHVSHGNYFGSSSSCSSPDQSHVWSCLSFTHNTHSCNVAFQRFEALVRMHYNCTDSSTSLCGLWSRTASGHAVTNAFDWSSVFRTTATTRFS